MSDETDKRRHYRPLARLDVKMSPAPGHILPPGLQAVTLDVAVGGVRCACNTRLEPQTLLRLTLTLVGGDLRQPATIETEARVRRCVERRAEPAMRRYAVAMEFSRLKPEDKKRLQAYLNSL
ncbi:MAG TPA: PilZ domain-containing protein [Candidatus Polarisedimenticolia bacterium]|nr:PilZ domain-containing protein [Candidatus Polarisedimenticolia bacterium]